ncbi:MAG: magnesium/cobalt transporter CorA [Bacteroidota bacterium]
MAHHRTDSSVKKGMSPGSLIFVGNQKMAEPYYELISFGKDDFNGMASRDLAEIEAAIPDDRYYWLNIEGLHDVEVIRHLGARYDVHPLVLEDILNTEQRPKVEDYGDYLFICLKMIWKAPGSKEIITEQFSMLVFEKCVISFQEQPGDVFDPIRKRFTNPKSRLRVQGTDYLVYTLLDTIIDNYIYLSEDIGQEIEVIETQLFESKGGHSEKMLLKRISGFKTDINFMRKIIRPTTDVILKINKNTSGQLSAENIPYFKDLVDLCQHAMETVEVYRETLYDQLVVYQTNVANRLNEVMKVLTVFSAIFIPLTFATGVYGTNFDFIPELHDKNGFYYFMGFLLVVGLGTWIYFKRKRWV